MCRGRCCAAVAHLCRGLQELLALLWAQAIEYATVRLKDAKPQNVIVFVRRLIVELLLVDA